MHASNRVILVLLFGFSWVSAPGQCNQGCPERPTVSVTGTATASADADQALVRVGYKIYGADAKSAYATASAASNNIMRALTLSGIAKNAIESTSQVLQRTERYELQMLAAQTEEYKQRQFTVIQSWTIRVKPDAAAEALNTAVDAGANESGWIEWTVLNPSLLQAEASKKALENARMIAERSVQSSGVAIGHLVTANEMQASPGNGMIGGSAGAVIGGVAGMVQPLAINSRRVEYSAAVFAVFAIQ
jgi:uncharacterized protein YggE